MEMEHDSVIRKQIKTLQEVLKRDVGMTFEGVLEYTRNQEAKKALKVVIAQLNMIEQSL